MATVRLQTTQMTNEERRVTVLMNIVKMLTSRGLLDPADEERNHEFLTNQVADDLVYQITAGNLNIAIKFIPVKVTTLSRTGVASDFLQAHRESHKILVVSDISQKIYKVLQVTPMTEIFWEPELMCNKIDHDYVPPHRVLTDQERADFMETYHLKKKDLPRIHVTDPIARYYNMKVGDVVHITRPSITSGYSSTYRIVINAPVSNLFG